MADGDGTVSVLPDSYALDAVRSPDATAAVDAACRIVGVNDVFRSMFGHDSADVVGSDIRNVLQLRIPDGAAIPGWHSSSALTSVRGTPQIELLAAHARGRQLSLVATIRYVRVDGVLAGATVSFRDPASRRLTTGAAHAVATVAHEIRAPLTSVRGFTSLLLAHGDEISADDRIDMLRRIGVDADRMGRLVGELLDVSRLEAGRLMFHNTAVDVAAVCRDAVDAAVAGLGDDDTSDVPAVSSNGAPNAWCDADKLRQIVVNLVENACKYGEPPVTVVVRTDEDDVVVEVRDAGTVSPEDVPKFFSRYWKRSLPGRPTGTGLGLSIARALAHAQDGSLGVSSGDGEGTVFELRLPLA